MPTVHLNNIDINYHLEGDGPETIVLVNGLADALESWDFQVPALLQSGFRVLRFDNRGIGGTEAPTGPYTARMLADDAKALVDELGIDNLHLIGVSMGGMIAQEYALNYPQDLRSVTLACTYAAPGPFCSRMFSMWEEMAQKVSVPFVMRDVTLWAFTVPFFSEQPDTAAEFEAEMAGLDMSVEAYLSQLHVIQEHDTTGRIAQLKVPTMVLAGQEDILIPTRLSHELHDMVPGSEWTTVPGGHACLWESPDPFNDAIITFIRAHSN